MGFAHRIHASLVVGTCFILFNLLLEMFWVSFCQITAVSPTEQVGQCKRQFWVTSGKTSGLLRKS